YLIGRNNSILHYIENGFVPGMVFFAFVLCSLAVIQIWNFSTFYINLYGRNGIRDHVFLIVNMYLLYHMADGISTAWHTSIYRFCIAWTLILVNIGLQHLIEMKNHRAEPWVLEMLKGKCRVIFGEAALVVVHMLVYYWTGMSIAYVPILFGIIMTALSYKVNMIVPVDFEHLSERAMLFVVFTFGEMIISITSYFEGGVTPTSLYFSTMAFLIVVGLFLSYEVLYNRIVDRELTTNGTIYMLIHVFMILALDDISVALEFMREEEVALLPKIMYITGSFIMYFICLFLMDLFAKKRCALNAKFHFSIALLGVSFFLLMYFLRTNMFLNIAVSGFYVMGIFLILYNRSKRIVEEA
ncbi:MAG: low temperature requirement protein A, partial [Lachnospiraceae bacterium]|nr:low temperature requirement protein A [Lachnospiraceae bacterium]